MSENKKNTTPENRSMRNSLTPFPAASASAHASIQSRMITVGLQRVACRVKTGAHYVKRNAKDILRNPLDPENGVYAAVGVLITALTNGIRRVGITAGGKAYLHIVK